jgi:hypothetical protein
MAQGKSGHVADARFFYPEINPKMASDIAYWSEEFGVTGAQLHGGVSGATALGCGFGFRNVIFPSWFLSRWRLSPLFHEGAQILFFPPP